MNTSRPGGVPATQRHDFLSESGIFPLRTLVGGLAGIGLVFLALVLTYWQLDQRATVRARTSVVTTRNVERMRYYDEALTMSARLNPFSAGRTYERRYLRLAPQLDNVIRDTVKLVDDRQAAADIALTGDANRRLVAMEMHSFALVRAGEPRRASALLTSPAYNTQKRRYAHGFKQALSRFTYVTAKMSKDAALYVSVMLGVSFALLLFGILSISVYLVRAARRWSAERKSAYEDTLAHEILLAQNEQLRELDRMKDEFVATISHELRTPLTSIRGYLELLRDEEVGLSEQSHDFLAVIDRNSKRLLGLITDLLFLAQVDHGQLELEIAPFRLQQLVEEAVASAQPYAAAQQITLLTHVDNVAEVAGDRARLAQLLDNLVSNALKFTPPGGRVEVRLGRDTDGSTVLEVADTGIGIPQAEQDKLFERFFRSTTATKNAIAGTGLGLSIAKLTAEAHGGTLSVESIEGEGTTFRVVLPLPLATLPVAA